jgi:SAM-dependent methyltransferase
MTTGNVYSIDVFFKKEGEKRDNIICLNDIEKLPENELDCIFMMDVLEHIGDDDLFFSKAIKKLKPNSTLIITVPAFQSLYSEHDVSVMHHRRYEIKQLMKLLKHEDLKIEKCHFIYTSLFLAQLLLKLFENSKVKVNATSRWKYPQNSIITKTFRTILNIDFYVNKILNKFFIRLPGLSLLAICRKKMTLNDI